MASTTPQALRLLRQSKASSYICARCSRFSSFPALSSGHNRWSKIKHDKAGVDKKKNIERSQLARDIMQASKLYGGDPTQNPALASVLVLAKKAGFPKASQEAAIARGQGISLTGAALESLTLEVMMPPSVAMVIELETENKARTFQNVKTDIKKNWGTVTPTAYLFKKRGRVQFEKDERNIGMDQVFDSAIEHGAEDVEEDDEGNLVVWTEPSDTMATAKGLAEEYKMKIADTDVIWDPLEDTKTVIDNEEELDQLITMVSKLQEDPAVTAIYANCKKGPSIDDDHWAVLAEKIPV